MRRVFDWSNLPLGESNMLRHASKVIMAFACVAVTTQAASAQAKMGQGFGVGYNDVGAVIGLGGLNGASASFGGRFEHAIKNLPEFGNGVLGIQAAFDYYSWSDDFNGAGFGYSWSYKYIPIGVTANYHFKLDEPKIDPFVGLGLGYNIVSCNVSGTFNGDCGYSSGIYAIARAGARYFFSPSMAAYGDVGAGGGALHLCLMFKF
jgi:hypothetical protein